MNTYNVFSLHSGQLKPAARSPGNRRLYTDAQLKAVLNRVAPKGRVTIAYAKALSVYACPVRHRSLTWSISAPRWERFCMQKGFTVDEWVAEIGGTALNQVLEADARSEGSTES